MKSKVAQRIYANTLEKTKQRARAYADELVKQSKTPQPLSPNEP